MAEPEKKEGGAESKPAAPAKKKPPIKTIGIVAGIMIAEGAAVFFVVGKTGKAPEAAKAELHGEDHAAEEALVELKVADDRFQNMSTGRVWVWDMSVYIRVRHKDEESTVTMLESRAAEIAEGIAQIMRSAQHSSLKEPGLETLNRQITGFLGKLLGQDAEGHDLIDRVFIPKCRGFPADA